MVVCKCRIVNALQTSMIEFLRRPAAGAPATTLDEKDPPKIILVVTCR
jgi:hypothetical protein